MKDPFTDEEAKQFALFGATDRDVINDFLNLDRLNMNKDYLKRPEREGIDKDQVSRCRSISLLVMQQYYFCWTLMLIYAGDYEKYS